MKKRKTITYRWLKEQGGCEDEVDRFHDHYRGQLRITKENILDLSENWFDLFWLAARMFSKSGCDSYRDAIHRKITGECMSTDEFLRFKASVWYKIWKEM